MQSLDNARFLQFVSVLEAILANKIELAYNAMFFPRQALVSDKQRSARVSTTNIFDMGIIWSLLIVRSNCTISSGLYENTSSNQIGRFLKESCVVCTIIVFFCNK